jgi:hypothetical protein
MISFRWLWIMETYLKTEYLDSSLGIFDSACDPACETLQESIFEGR